MHEFMIELWPTLSVLLGGGLVASVLLHWREYGKARAIAAKTGADAHHREAETKDMDWARFQREIARLTQRLDAADKKIEAQDRRIAELERDLIECHQRHTQAEAELIKLRAVNDAMGDARQLSQLIVSSEKKAQSS